jgi:hypothetical protein
MRRERMISGISLKRPTVPASSEVQRRRVIAAIASARRAGAPDQAGSRMRRATTAA